MSAKGREKIFFCHIMSFKAALNYSEILQKYESAYYIIGIFQHYFRIVIILFNLEDIFYKC